MNRVFFFWIYLSWHRPEIVSYSKKIQVIQTIKYSVTMYHHFEEKRRIFFGNKKIGYSTKGQLYLSLFV